VTVEPFLLSLVIPLLLAGCSSSPEAASAEVQPTTAPASTTMASPSPTLVDLGEVGTVSDLRDAAVAAGYACPSWEQDNVVAAAAESGHCSDGDVFSVYTSESARDEVVSFMKGMATKEIPLSLLVGPNWIINSEDASALESALGGVVVSAP
jgi:hypothetical protein